MFVNKHLSIYGANRLVPGLKRVGRSKTRDQRPGPGTKIPGVGPGFYSFPSEFDFCLSLRCNKVPKCLDHSNQNQNQNQNSLPKR